MDRRAGGGCWGRGVLRAWRKPWGFPGILLVGQWAFVEALGEGRPGAWVPLVRGSEQWEPCGPWTREDASSWPRGVPRGLSCCVVTNGEEFETKTKNEILGDRVLG